MMLCNNECEITHSSNPLRPKIYSGSILAPMCCYSVRKYVIRKTSFALYIG